MAANNEVGTILPIDKYVTIIRQKNSQTLIHSDMSQTLGKAENISVGDLDAATFTSHKFGGPTGIGILYCKNFDVMDSLIHGGSQEFVKRAGTYSAHQIVGMGKAVELLEFSNYRNCIEVRQYAEKKLKEIGCIINCEDSLRLCNTISAILPNMIAENIVKKLSELGIFISAGSACNSYEKTASYVLKSMGVSDVDAYNTIRISLNRFTLKEEIDEFIITLNNLKDTYNGQQNILCQL